MLKQIHLKFIIRTFGIFSLLLLSSCISQDEINCYTKIADIFCESNNMTFEGDVHKVGLGLKGFYCYYNRQNSPLYKYTEEEIIRCG